MKKLYSALMTAFNEDGSVNLDGVRAMVRYNIDVNHIDGLYVGGSTGETFMLNVDEKKAIFKAVYEEANGAIDLIAQVGSLNITEAKELARYVTALGYPMISAVTPFYYNFTFEQIKNYYNEILADVDNKLIVYSIPALTGVSLSLDQFAELFENPKIVGIKYTNPDFYLLERVRERFPDKLLLSGFDEMLLPALSVGVDGAIGSTFNVNAPRAKQEIAAFEAGNNAQALALQRESNDLIAAILDNDLYPTIKLLFKELGVDAGICKQPMSAPTSQMKVGAHEIYTRFFQNSGEEK